MNVILLLMFILQFFSFDIEGQMSGTYAYAAPSSMGTNVLASVMSAFTKFPNNQAAAYQFMMITNALKNSQNGRYTLKRLK